MRRMNLTTRGILISMSLTLVAVTPGYTAVYSLKSSSQYSLTVLGTLADPVPNPPDSLASISYFGQAINEDGDVVGVGRTEGAGPQVQFLYHDGMMSMTGSATEWPGVPPLGYDPRIPPVTDASDGWANYAIWQKQIPFNASGEALDYTFRASPDGNGLVWDERSVDLGALAPGRTYADFNDVGWVVGNYWFDQTVGIRHAFSCVDGQTTDLGAYWGGATNSYATDINARGDIIGYYSSGLVSYVVGGSFMYGDGNMTDLTQLVRDLFGVERFVATGINDAGQISGYGYTGEAGERAMILETAPSPVPEPATALLLASGLAGLLGCRKRRIGE